MQNRPFSTTVTKKSDTRSIIPAGQGWVKGEEVRILIRLHESEESDNAT